MKKRTRGILAALLALVMLVSCSCVPAFAREITQPTTVAINYVVSKNDKTVDFVYSDELFSQSGYNYRQDLATMSLAMGLSGGASQRARQSGDMANMNRNFRHFADVCGFSKYGSNTAMKTRPKVDTIGVNCASKQITDSKGKATLIAVAIRGFGYQNEWGDNFRVGASGDHQGFSNSRYKALEFLKKYIKDAGIKGRIKIWASGYSRGGAVSNMLGGSLDDGYDLGKDVTLSRDDMYIYPAEPALGAVQGEVKDPKYNNIHNIVNPNDVVCYVGFPAWGFARYGQDHNTPTKADPNYQTYDSKMKEFMRSIPNDTYNIYFPDYFQAWDVNTSGNLITGISKSDKLQPEFYSDLGQAVTKSFTTSRQDYVDNLQDAMIDFGEMYGREDIELTDGLEETAKILGDNWQTVLTDLLSLNKDQIEDHALDYVAQGFQKAGNSDWTKADWKGVLDQLIPRAKRMAQAYPSTTATLIANLVQIIACHSAAPCQSWLKTLPADYMKNNVTYSYNLK